MSTEDKIKFQAKLQETFLKALVTHMGGFDPANTSLRYDTTRFRNRGEAVVRIKVIRQDQPTARLEFGMQRTDNKWRIVDVKANGTSAVLYYRRHFIAELREHSDRDFDRSRREYIR
jgi:phospholipid transport system substrate-binding protein